MDQITTKRGRPPKADRPMDVTLRVRAPAAMVDAIDAISAARMDAPDRSSVVRELLAEALEARRKKR
jgi:metal-responsive CopG/Arc/MetJ family transcriptional regulator